MATSTIKNNLELLNPYELKRSSSEVANFSINGTTDVQNLGTYTATDNGILQIRISSGTSNLDLYFFQVSDNAYRTSCFQRIWMPAYWSENVIQIPMSRNRVYSFRCKRATAVSTTDSSICIFTLTSQNT